MITNACIRHTFTLGIVLFSARTFDVGARYIVIAGFSPGEACHLNNLIGRPVQRRKTKWLQGVPFFLYVIPQREVTRSVTVNPGQMKKARSLPCQPLIFSMKINRGGRWGPWTMGK